MFDQLALAFLADILDEDLQSLADALTGDDLPPAPDTAPVAWMPLVEHPAPIRRPK